MMDKDTAATVMRRVDTTTIDVNPEPTVVFEEDAGALDLARTAKKSRNIARVRLLWDHRVFLAWMTGAGLLFFTLLAFLLPKRYTATARLMPPDYTSSISTGLALSAAGSDSGGGAGGAPLMGLASHLLGLNTSGELIVGVLRSQTLEDRIILKFDLMNEYGAKYLEDARKKLESRTDIQSDMKTGIITIAVENHDPRKAAAMAQEQIDALNELLAQVNTSAAHRERIFIGERLQTIKEELDAATKEFSVFASQNTAINIPDQIKAMVDAAANLQGQLIAAESQLKSMEQVYTENNVNVRQMKALVSELRSQLNKFGGKGVTPADGSKLSSDELYPSIRQLPLLGVRYLDLYRRSRIDEAAFELLSREYEIAKVQEAREVPSVAVLDVPKVPDKKSFPHRLPIMVLGTMLSFAAGAVAVLGRSGWREISHDDPGKILAEEIFATLRSRLSLASRNGHGSPDLPDEVPLGANMSRESIEGEKG
jgi:capsule polysaccharide export protein KpsE/RkpR